MTKPGNLSLNILANYLARITSIFLAVIFTPIYIKILGVEVYGVIGFYIALQATMGMLELGLGVASNREMARLSVLPDGIRKIQDTIRTFEILYCIVAALIGVVLTIAAPWIADQFLRSEALAHDVRVFLVQIMAWIIALRWPVGLYTGILGGLQRQVSMNVLLILSGVLNWVGGAIVLWQGAAVLVFFEWQLLVAVLTLIAYYLVTWQPIRPDGESRRFSGEILRAQFRFIGGAGLNVALGVVLMQADKLVLISIVPLKEFAYYTLAATVAEALLLLATPVSNALTPKIVQMIYSEPDSTRIRTFFHQSCQLVNLLLISVGAVIAIFPGELMFAYTGSHEVASNTAGILAILVVAKLLHGNMLVPYALQIGWGELKAGVYINIASVMWLVPAVIVLSSAYGATGAAISWLTVTVGYVFIGMPLVFRKLMPAEWGRWFMQDLAIPLFCVLIALVPIHWLSSGDYTTRSATLGMLVLYGLISLLVTAVTLSFVRNWLNSRFRA